ncbi:unnamed protein product, partial [Iphiclides podalirius]
MINAAQQNSLVDCGDAIQSPSLRDSMFYCRLSVFLTERDGLNLFSLLMGHQSSASAPAPASHSSDSPAMGFEKRTVKIMVIVLVLLLVIELEVWPRSDEYNHEEPLIHFRVNDPGSWHPWYKRISDFLSDYETNVPEDPPRAPCSVQRHEQRVPNPNCERALSVWAPCIADNFYGYRDGTPCVFLRLSHYQRPASVFGDYVWVSCGGEFAADQENIGPLQYVPATQPPGFPTARLLTADHVPRAARSRPDPLSGPLVAVLFENPRRT